MLSIFSGFFSKAATEIKVGDQAPIVSAKDDTGKMVNLEDHFRKGYTLVYFYPKADTPGCTAQACSLRDAFAELTDKGVKVFGVSTDNVDAQRKFKEKYRLPFSLLADTDKSFAKAFGVPVRMGFAGRQAFLIRDGIFVWIDRSASTKKQAEDVLTFLAGN